jgi:hypothetical protein
MSLILAIPLAFLLLGGFLLLLFVGQRLYRRLQRTLTEHGYKSPVLLTLGSGFAFLLTIAGIVLATAIDEDALVPAIILITLVVPVLLTLAVRLLPARNPRTGGRRSVRFPYGRAAQACFAVSAGFAIAAPASGVPQLMSVAVSLAVAGLTCREIARRATIPDLATTLATDSRAPVLYLRPFQQDEDVFVEVPRSRREFWTDWRRNIARHTTSQRFVTLDGYVRREITASIGPLVALGNPLDFVPPHGAARVYAPDDSWRDQFAELAQRAACCLLVAGLSSQVGWELTRLRELGLHQRLFVVTKPLRQRMRSGGRGLAGLLGSFLTKPPRLHFDPPVAWSEFSALLQRAGYTTGSGDPGPGSVVSFDVNARVVVLARDARSAAEIVSAIASALGGRDEVRATG